MTNIIGIFKETLEYKNLGLNALTISAIATIIFSLLQAYGILKQGKEIRQKKSGESIAPIFFVYNFLYFFIFFIYGLYENSIAIILNGALSFLYLPILVGLNKYKGFTKKEILLSLSMLPIVPAMFIYPEKNQLLFFFSGLSIIVVIRQFKELLRKKDLGALSLKYIWMFFITSIFWCMYFMATKKWLLEIPCLTGTMLYALILVMQRRWKIEERLAPLTFYALWRMPKK